jgi:hypothetical protein
LLPEIYSSFGSDVKFTLNPFVKRAAQNQTGCIDGVPPCTLEQEALNVIDNHPQDKYVPWLICMDKSDDDIDRCDSEVGISKPASTAPQPVLEKHYKGCLDIPYVPYVQVNGMELHHSYSAIRTALCKVEPSLPGCSKAMPSNHVDKIQQVCEKPSDMVVV